jgi:taurine-pyruvate aminotransferase
VIVGRSGGGARHSNTIVLSPPLIITRSECDTLIEVLDKALADAVAKMAGKE